MKKEQEEKERKRKEKAEAHLYTIIKVRIYVNGLLVGSFWKAAEADGLTINVHVIQVGRDEDLQSQIGKDIHFDLVDHEKVRSFRIQKQTLFTQFKVCASNQFRW